MGGSERSSESAPLGTIGRWGDDGGGLAKGRFFLVFMFLFLPPCMYVTMWGGAMVVDRYHGDWRSEAQTVVSLLALLHWLETGNLLLHREVEEKLGCESLFFFSIQ